MWLMVRVVSAVPMTNQLTTDSAITIDRGLGLFSGLKTALEGIPMRVISGDRQENLKVLSILKSYDSFEEFLRGPIPKTVFNIPRSKVPLNKFEYQVYRVLAVQYLHPEYRLVFELSHLVNEQVAAGGWFISHFERGKAQDHCFKKNDFSEDCLLNIAFTPVIKEFVEKVNLKYASQLDLEDVTKEVLRLTKKKKSNSLYYREGFIADGAHFYQNKFSSGFHISLCISHPVSFRTWELIGSNRCEKVFKKHFEEQLIMDEAVQSRVLKYLFDPYSYYQLAMVSLTEDVLNRGLICYSNDCVRRKISERIEEWNYRSLLNNAQRRRIIYKISILWLE
jgi:hypothetical protein